MMDVVYILDDHFEIPDEIKKMSDEERHQLAKRLEEEGKKEKEKIMANGNRKTLLAI